MKWFQFGGGGGGGSSCNKMQSILGAVVLK